MAETGDSGIPRGEIAPATSFRAHHKFNMISAGILEPDKSSYPALAGVFGGASLHMMAKAFQRGCRLLQTVVVLDLKSDGLIRRVAFGITKRVRPVVRSQVKHLLAAL